MRIDQLLVERGLASSRSQAQRLIASGVQWRAGTPGVALWKRAAKNGDEVPDAAEIELLDLSEARYVSRGGLKLEGALKTVGLDVAGLTCLDIGQSTGGFTDCLLRQGAALVVGVDVGSGQLHDTLRSDARVLCVEQCNARNLDASDLIAAWEDSTRAEGEFDAENAADTDTDTDTEDQADFDGTAQFITGDLSFISLTLVLPALVPLLKPEGDLLMLVKPQFELQPGQVGKGGIVRDPALYAVVEQRLRDAAAALGLRVLAWFDSPIAGGDGNREFFIHCRKAP
jgi:23S rRNA (cytidine1920-2'-O)/16S rRNA (cytidine1409-2'-O)-methyltransferase